MLIQLSQEVVTGKWIVKCKVKRVSAANLICTHRFFRDLKYDNFIVLAKSPLVWWPYSDLILLLQGVCWSYFTIYIGSTLSFMWTFYCSIYGNHIQWRKLLHPYQSEQTFDGFHTAELAIIFNYRIIMLVMIMYT